MFEISVPVTGTYESRGILLHRKSDPFASLTRLGKQQKSLLVPPLCMKLGFNQFQIQLCSPEIQRTTKLCPRCLETTVLCLQEHLLWFIQITGNANS